MTRTSCPKCGECPFVNGVCEQKIARGRRFFMLGALALPVAAKIESISKLVAPPTPEYAFYGGGSLFRVGDYLWVWQEREAKREGYIVTKINSDYTINMRRT